MEKVAVAGIGQEDDYVLALVLRTLCKLYRSPDSRAGGYADQHASVLPMAPTANAASSLATGDYLVIHLGIQRRHEAAPCPVCLCARQRRWTTPLEVAGSTATTFTPGTFSLKVPAPLIVPPVPTPATK